MSKRPKWWLNFIAFIWPLTWMSGRVYRWPVLGAMLKYISLPLFSKKRQNLTYIPINEGVSGAESTYLPREIVAELIRRSKSRAIIHHCTCRLDRACKEHPVDLGCILLGEGVLDIDPNIAKKVSVGEALSHLDRALKNRLIPLVGRAPIDHLLYGISFKGRFLTVCFCCRCCCTILKSGRYLPREIHESLVPLEGMKIITDRENCVLCGVCADECFMGALSIVEGELIRDPDRCKACGLCIAVCPEGAIEAKVEDVEYVVKEIIGRVRGFVGSE
ncbi:MAG: 4Fe-4S binding protein [Deltaproteobacteria bacterium]|uniref:4Fe-4S binding protein n=1 Tax=Candidatus Zymogenus saltonus TaxID=2844893 RepID=A0A9D8KDM0_9DELT|nr:4Fe-4S binding protein [Candidatus Zymogenus saltonus]